MSHVVGILSVFIDHADTFEFPTVAVNLQQVGHLSVVLPSCTFDVLLGDAGFPAGRLSRFTVESAAISPDQGASSAIGSEAVGRTKHQREGGCDDLTARKP